MAYQLMTKNAPPETGYKPAGKLKEDRKGAVEAAKDKAKDHGVYGNTVQIEAEDGIEVITVTFTAGEVLNVSYDDVITRAPGQFSITTDTRTAEVVVNKDEVVQGKDIGQCSTELMEA